MTARQFALKAPAAIFFIPNSFKLWSLYHGHIRVADASAFLSAKIGCCLGSVSNECDRDTGLISSDGGLCSVPSCSLHRLGHLRRFLHARPAAARRAARCLAGVRSDRRNLWLLVPAHGAGRVA